MTDLLNFDALIRVGGAVAVKALDATAPASVLHYSTAMYDYPNLFLPPFILI